MKGFLSTAGTVTANGGGAGGVAGGGPSPSSLSLNTAASTALSGSRSQLNAGT